MYRPSILSYPPPTTRVPACSLVACGLYFACALLCALHCCGCVAVTKIVCAFSILKHPAD